MENAPGLGVVQHDGEGIPMGLPVVDNNGQVQLYRQLDLPPEDRLLELPGRIVLPIVVQAGLAYGYHLLVPAEVSQGGKLRLSGPGAVRGVDACGGVDKGILLRQGAGRPGTLQVASGVHYQAHPGGGEGGEDFVPVGVEAAGIVVGMSVKNRHRETSSAKQKGHPDGCPFGLTASGHSHGSVIPPGTGICLDQPIRLSFRVMALFL